MSNWLADRTGIHLNLRPYAGAAGALAGGALGSFLPGLGTSLGASLGAGLFKTGDNLAHGDSAMHALGQGALNAGLTYAGGKGLEKLKSAFSPSSTAAVEGGKSAAGSVAPSLGGAGGMEAGTIGNAASAANMPIQGAGAASLARVGEQAPSWLSAANSQGSSFGNAARGVGSFIKDNPNAIGQGLQGLGSMQQADSMNRLRRSQADQQDYELGIQKSRDVALEPLRRALAGQFGQLVSQPRQFPTNPYSQR